MGTLREALDAMNVCVVDCGRDAPRVVAEEPARGGACLAVHCVVGDARGGSARVEVEEALRRHRTTGKLRDRTLSGYSLYV